MKLEIFVMSAETGYLVGGHNRTHSQTTIGDGGGGVKREPRSNILIIPYQSE